MAIIIQVQRRETGMWATLSDGTVVQFQPEQADAIYAAFDVRAEFDPETLASAETVDDGSDAGSGEGEAGQGEAASTEGQGQGEVADNGAGAASTSNEAASGTTDGSAPTQAATEPEAVIGGADTATADDQTAPATPEEGKAKK